MGLTYEQARSVGMGHLHPAVSRGPIGLPMATRAAVESDGMNKTERRFRDDVLEPAYVRHDVARYWREPLKLRLAGRTYYTPDFLVEIPPGEHGLPPRLVFIEIKGFMRDDAAVKLKVAAGAYPCFGWLLVRAGRGHRWDVRRVGSGGIDIVPIVVPWIERGNIDGTGIDEARGADGGNLLSGRLDPGRDPGPDRGP